MSIAELIAAAKADGSYYENAWVLEEGCVEQLDSEPTLAELFAASDRIGDKYLSAEEIAERKRQLELCRLDDGELPYDPDLASYE